MWILLVAVAVLIVLAYWLKIEAQPDYDDEEYIRVTDQWHKSHGPPDA